jgi:hypothetical protein
LPQLAVWQKMYQLVQARGSKTVSGMVGDGMPVAKANLRRIP